MAMLPVLILGAVTALVLLALPVVLPQGFVCLHVLCRWGQPAPAALANQLCFLSAPNRLALLVRVPLGRMLL